MKHAAKQDFKGFYEEEILMRQMMGYPPFSSFFSILIVGEEKDAVEIAAQKLAEKLAKADGEEIASILGPVPAASMCRILPFVLMISIWLTCARRALFAIA